MKRSAWLCVHALYFFLSTFAAHAQNMYNSGSAVSVESSGKIYVKGSYFHAAGSIDNNGEVHIADSLVNNNASNGIFGDLLNRPSAGSVFFDGAANQQISGTGMQVLFYDFNFSNTSADTLKLFKPFELEGQLIFGGGNINLNGRTINLGGFGNLSGETNTRRIFGSSGYVTANRNLGIGFNGEIANFGFHLNAGLNNFGPTEIRRSHFALSPFSSNGNINRFYDLRPANPGMDPATSLTLEYFANETLPGHTTSDYKIFHSRSDGFSWAKQVSPAGDNPDIDFDVIGTNVTLLGTSAQNRSILTISEGNCLNGPVVDLGASVRNICEGTSIEISSDPGQQTYTWKKDGVVIAGETTHKITVTDGGLYELLVIDGNGCEGNDNVTLNVKQTPVADFQAANFACHGAATNFTNLSTSVDGSITYAWNFGDPAVTSDVSTQATPSYIYLSPGSFTATLTVTSQYGCVSTPKTNSAIVNALPVANFSSDQVCFGQATTLSNNAVSGINYSWDLSGGSTSNLTAPQFVFPFAGTHSVTLTATNTNTACTKSVTKTVTVNPKPVADFSSAPVCKSNEILFANTSAISSGTLNYAWTFGDGETGSVKNPFKIYQQAGAYDVTLEVSSELGCSGILTRQISVTMPLPIFTGDVVTCGNQVVLDANQNARFAGSTFLWSDNSTNPQLTATRSGNYSVTVTEPGGCKTTESVKVTLNTIIAPNLGSTIQACGSHVLDAGSYPGGAYTWSTGETTQTITINQSGIYAVQVLDQNSCSGSASVTLQVNPVPVVNLGADQVLCFGKTTQLDAGTDGNTYLWSDGSTSRFLQAGATNQYRVKVTNDFGCFNSDEVKVTIQSPVTVDLGPDKVICGNIPITLDAGVLNASYSWQSSVGKTGTSRTLEIDKGGVYKVSVSYANGCVASDSITINETTNTLNAEFLSASEVAPGDTIQFVNVSYPRPFESSWNFGNGQTSALEDPRVIYYAENDFTVSLTVTNGVCTDNKAKVIKVRRPSGRIAIVPVIRPDDIVTADAFPNPTDRLLNIDVTLSSEMEVRLQVVSLMGVIFYDKLMVTDHIDETIDMTGVTTGVYFIKIVTSRQVKTIRVFKQ